MVFVFHRYIGAFANAFHMCKPYRLSRVLREYPIWQTVDGTCES